MKTADIYLILDIHGKVYKSLWQSIPHNRFQEIRRQGPITIGNAIRIIQDTLNLRFR